MQCTRVAIVATNIVCYQVNGMWKGMFKADQVSTDMKNACKETMERVLSEPRLAEGLIPEFGFGCRRSSPVSCLTQHCKYDKELNLDRVSHLWKH